MCPLSPFVSTIKSHHSVITKSKNLTLVQFCQFPANPLEGVGMLFYFLVNFLQSAPALESFLVFHDLDTFEELWSIILQNVSQSGFVMCFQCGLR